MTEGHLTIDPSGGGPSPLLVSHGKRHWFGQRSHSHVEEYAQLHMALEFLGMSSITSCSIIDNLGLEGQHMKQYVELAWPGAVVKLVRIVRNKQQP